MATAEAIFDRKSVFLIPNGGGIHIYKQIQQRKEKPHQNTVEETKTKVIAPRALCHANILPSRSQFHGVSCNIAGVFYS
ncbi:hypothetical protein CEXT_75001 [Caerostris extrusa]|uniref:Uncharacterized protein n=1 Tax=Caerostris extrusa TaxID=172846 RepID=A0AAV4RJJ9_CAEEX|nr:hypothetical protein CEXT_75001 [Caerostris extrusa]